MVMIKVVCGIISKGEQIFICRRKPNKSQGGFWEFPGGKIESNESHEDSLKRELFEELKMKVQVAEYFDSSYHEYDNISIELIAYKCILKSWNNFLSVHDSFEWVNPNDLLNWNLAPADIPLAIKIRGNNSVQKRV